MPYIRFKRKCVKPLKLYLGEVEWLEQPLCVKDHARTPAGFADWSQTAT